MVFFFNQRNQAGQNLLYVAHKLSLSVDILVDFGRVNVDMENSGMFSEGLGISDYAIREA